MAQKVSLKHIMIDKANTTIVAVTAAAAFVSIFSLVAIKALVNQAGYQNRVIAVKKQTLNQLNQDITAGNQLKSAYTAFVKTPQNIIGGNPTGSGPRDGDNTKIVLDALPSQYDFPALATSLQNILNSQNLTTGGITGSDAQLSQQNAVSTPTPTPVPMPFGVSVAGSYQGVQNLVSAFENSIRPFQFQTMQFSGDQTSLTMSITAQTFYQPPKTLTITSEVVK